MRIERTLWCRCGQVLKAQGRPELGEVLLIFYTTEQNEVQHTYVCHMSFRQTLDSGATIGDTERRRTRTFE